MTQLTKGGPPADGAPDIDQLADTLWKSADALVKMTVPVRGSLGKVVDG